MKIKRALMIMTAIAKLAAFAAFGIFHETQPVQARVATLPVNPLTYPHLIKPSDTDDDKLCGEMGAIGCDDEQWTADGNPGPSLWGDLAINKDTYLYVPTNSIQPGKLLVFLCGGNGSAPFCENVYPVAAQQGYHVIGLTYPAIGLSECSAQLPHDERLECFGEVMKEVVTGNEWSDKSHLSEHRQDAVVNRLVSLLKWARSNQNQGDGWELYLTQGDGVDWAKVHLAGFSNGSSHASFMGTLPEFQSIRRVALFAGPNDGDPNSQGEWKTANYVQLIEGITDTRYYGLVHKLNNAPDELHDVLYKVTDNWHKFGMEGSFELHPPVAETQDFGSAHMLISLDPPPTDTDLNGTTARDAHNSVVRGKYCPEYGGTSDSCQTPESQQVEIGYEPAWRCILGTGNEDASTEPTSDAGPDQTVECQGNGGATVVLDGSASTDPNCDILSYLWAGPFGFTTGRNPSVFCPLGSNTVGLFALDDWSASLVPDTMLATVVDTQPPSLSVALTPAVLWTPDHRLVRIDATVNASDSCGGTPPSVVLTSITSNQPDNGVGDGDTDNDIQDAQIGTFDQSFLLRAERAGGDPNGRTYTVTYTATDASGNQTQVIATVHVPHS